MLGNETNLLVLLLVSTIAWSEVSIATKDAATEDIPSPVRKVYKELGMDGRYQKLPGSLNGNIPWNLLLYNPFLFLTRVLLVL